MVTAAPADLAALRQRQALHAQVFGPYRDDPVGFVTGFCGADPDPWQCDVLSALADPTVPNVAVRSCHGVGKTVVLSWAILWFFMTRWESVVVATAPTYNKQVKDVLFGRGVSYWWTRVCGAAPFLTGWFTCQSTRLQAVDAGPVRLSQSWFGVGIASKEAANLEGYRAESILFVFDEAKAVPKPTWEAVRGMRTTREAKFLVASTPGALNSEFHLIWKRHRTTWPVTFDVHPAAVRDELGKPETVGVHPVSGKPCRGRYARGGCYYSPRYPAERVRELAADWGTDNPAYTARVLGEFPELDSNKLIPYGLIEAAEFREQGAEGPVVVGCDVARSGRDRTVVFAARGGTVLEGAAVGRTAAETTAPALTEGVGPDPQRPYYRDEVATADLCEDMAKRHGAVAIGVDDTGLGGGVTTILRRRGWTVVPVVFGATPTDKPRDKETRDWKVRREGAETRFFNLKAQMAWALKRAFEDGAVALEALNADDQARRTLLLPLLAQLADVRKELTDKGLLRVVDPDMADTDDTYFDDHDEGRRSPDHLHALMIAWWLAGGGYRPLKAGAGQAAHQGRAVGRPRPAAVWGANRAGVVAGAPTQPVSRTGVGGHAVHLDRLV